MVLEVRDHHLVARLEARRHEAPGDQVDRLGGAAGEDDLLDLAGADEAAGAVAGAFVGVGRPLRQGVHPAVHVGVVVFVVAGHRVEHRPRLLGGGRVVEVESIEPEPSLCGMIRGKGSRVARSSATSRPMDLHRTIPA